MPGTIRFHYDGPIARDHRLSLRVLGQSLIHLQSAIDRAHLDNKYGNVWKYARLKTEDYPETDFVVGTPQEGGYILDLIRDAGSPIVKRISAAISRVFEADWNAGAEGIEHLAHQVTDRRLQLEQGLYPGRTIDEFRASPGIDNLRRYGDRSIAKEIDQMLAPIRRNSDPEAHTGNVLELIFNFGGQQPTTFLFDQSKAIGFHRVVSKRELGEPLRYSGRLRLLDRGNAFQRPKAKLTLAGENRDVMLHIPSQAAYQTLAPYMQGDQEVHLIACPILEFNSFDPNSGDIFFVCLLD
jgi:hypothetical protein